MKHSEDCKDCMRLAGAYEATTIAFFRLQNQFDIACLSGDSDALCKLAVEIDQAAARRRELKEQSRKHLASPQAQGVGQ